MDKTTETTPTQPELVLGAQLVCYWNNRLQSDRVFTVERLTATQAKLVAPGPEGWSHNVKRKPIAGGRYSWLRLENSYSGFTFALATPAQLEVARLAPQRKAVDALMKQVSGRSHLLTEAQLQLLAATMQQALATLPVEPPF